jgi:hypothetical protein
VTQEIPALTCNNPHKFYKEISTGIDASTQAKAEEQVKSG